MEYETKREATSLTGSGAGADVSAPVFVVGPPRCGTTLMARLIGRHETMFMPGETHYMHDVFGSRTSDELAGNPHEQARVLSRLRTLYGRYNEALDQQRVERLFADTEAWSEDYFALRDHGEVFDWFMRLQMRASGKSRWGNNAPKDIFRVRDVLTMFPDARFVICVRDPRDFLTSYKFKWRATTPEHVERLKKLYHPVLTSLVWRASVKRIKDIEHSVHPDRYVVVKYENLVDQPEMELSRVCECVGIEYFPEMLEITENNSSRASAEGGIFSSSVGSWRREIDPAETNAALLVCWNQLGRLGYARTLVRCNWIKLAGYFASLPFGVVRAVLANRGDDVRLAPYLWARARALIG
jgi:hypothetical protein